MFMDLYTLASTRRRPCFGGQGRAVFLENEGRKVKILLPNIKQKQPPKELFLK